LPAVEALRVRVSSSSRLVTTALGMRRRSLANCTLHELPW
jgi:hypothetical protein